MSKLTKAQWRVIELLYRGTSVYKINSSCRTWYVAGERTRFNDAIGVSLLNTDLVDSEENIGVRQINLRLTEAGKQLARERFEQQ